MRLKTRRGAKKAIMAVAASMVTAIYHMLHTQTPYRDLGGDHFDQRDKREVARRLIRRLGTLGYSVEIQAVA